jgi:hypothetical protein
MWHMLVYMGTVLHARMTKLLVLAGLQAPQLTQRSLPQGSFYLFSRFGG